MENTREKVFKGHCNLERIRVNYAYLRKKEAGKMKKIIACLLKLFVALSVLAAAAWAVVTYWDSITELLAGLREKFCPCCGGSCPCEEDDFVD